MNAADREKLIAELDAACGPGSPSFRQALGRLADYIGERFEPRSTPTIAANPLLVSRSAFLPETEVTLRDVFAAFALGGERANRGQHATLLEPIDFASAAARAYNFADAMLAERERKP